MKNQKDNGNRIITQEVIQGEKGPYISEVQTFKEPEDYADAFKKYYPSPNNK